jgi:hypothetical protein
MTTLTQARLALHNISCHIKDPTAPWSEFDLVALTDYLDHQVAAQIEAHELTARMLRAEGFVRESESAFKRLQHARLTALYPPQVEESNLPSQMAAIFGSRYPR